MYQCGVEAIVSVDDRGQMVLPKSVRDKAGIKAGDKFAVVTCESGGELCCILLVKADKLAEMVKEIMSPFMASMGGVNNVSQDKE